MGSYLVTGAAGFIGSKVSELLLADGQTVVGIDNLNDAYDPRLKHRRLAYLQALAGFSFSEVDIRDRAGLEALFSSQPVPFDGVINLAARAGVRQSVEDPWIYIETNTTGTVNLLESCRQHEVRKFVLASTSSLYGSSTVQPFAEDADTNGPLSPYAASKKAAEVLCYTYHYLYGLDVSVVRYFTVFGPAGRPDMSLFRFVQWISEGRPVTVFGNGEQSRDFTFVDDIARGTIAALRPLGYEIMNLGSDTPVRLMDAIRLIEDLLGEEAQLQFEPHHAADVLATWADIRKAERLLDWRPQVTFHEGVERLVRWYQENRDWAKDLRTS